MNSLTSVRRVTKKLIKYQKERNPSNIRDWLATKFLEKDDGVNWPGNSVINNKNLPILRLNIVHRQNQW